MMMNYYQQPQNNNGIIWVQGLAGAKSYLVAPNTTVQLWDSESQTIYLKSADMMGMPTIKILDYTIRNSEETKLPIKIDDDKNYISREEFDKKIEELKSMIERGDKYESVI